MASTARLFILLAAAIPILAIPDSITFNSTEEKNELCNFYYAVLYRRVDTNGFCPPFASKGIRTTIVIMGNTSWSVGYASMVPENYDIAPRFNLWLPKTKTVGGKLNKTDMDHYIFECWATGPYYFGDASVADKYGDWMFVILYDRDARWSGHPNHLLCAAYKRFLDPSMMKVVISKNNSCYHLMKSMDIPLPEDIGNFTDESVALNSRENSKQTSVWRNKRSEGGRTRFHHESVLHENDHVDYNQENDDGKDAHAKTTGVEHYILRSQRHDPVGISGIDHSSSYVESKKETNNEKKQNLKLH